MALELREDVLGALSPKLKLELRPVLLDTIGKEYDDDAREVTFFRVPPLDDDAVRLLVRSDVDLSERFVTVPKGKR